MVEVFQPEPKRMLRRFLKLITHAGSDAVRTVQSRYQAAKNYKSSSHPGMAICPRKQAAENLIHAVAEQPKCEAPKAKNFYKLESLTNRPCNRGRQADEIESKQECLSEVVPVQKDG